MRSELRLVNLASRLMRSPTARLRSALTTTRVSPSSAGLLCPCSFPEVAQQRMLSLSACWQKMTSRRRRTEKSGSVSVLSKIKKKSDKPEVHIYRDMTLRELATNLGKELDEVLDVCLDLSSNQKQFLTVMDNPDEFMNRPEILMLAAAFNCKTMLVDRNADSNASTAILENLIEHDIGPRPPAPPEECERRPPVVTIMGHVDHGKTTLLDALRHSHIVQHEFGGITQHIGAFSVKLPSSKSTVTFLDTPGHAAFKAMRERGARCTDIVVLVVAADDSVMEQTVESIRYAKEAGVPIVVAINKCDKPLVDTHKVRNDLMAHDVVVEGMGGDVQAVEISALQGTGLEQLQEALLAQAELMDLKATRHGLVEGVVIESATSPGLGTQCTLVVHRGTLRKGNALIAGESHCRVRTIHNEHGQVIGEAGPSFPVRVAGWKGDNVPTPGDLVLEVENEAHAEKIAQLRNRLRREERVVEEKVLIDEKMAEDRKRYEELLAEKYAAGLAYGSTIRNVLHRRKENQYRRQERDLSGLALLLRCDVEGSLEAILNVLETYHGREVKLNIVDFDLGPPRESDFVLASDFRAHIICFNVPVPMAIREQATAKKIPLEHFNVIYKLVEYVKDKLSEQLAPHKEDVIYGEGHVLKEFRVQDPSSEKKQPIAGTMIDRGVFDKSKDFRIMRGPQVIYDGKVMSLKREADFVRTAEAGYEVGISLDDKRVRFKPDDHVQVYETVITPRRIDWYPEGF